MIINNDIAVVFPGQGSQSIGMMNELVLSYPEIKNTFSEASEVLNYDLWEKISEGSDSELNRTEITQPALLTASYATWRLWKEKIDFSPSLLAGHSLGEYTALVCSGVISFSDAVWMVSERGKYMQKAVPEGVGSMAAIIGLENEEVISICMETSSDKNKVSAANFNAPGQVVISGDKEAVELAIKIAKDKGARRAILLPVSVPSHSVLMKKIADDFAKNVLDSISFNDAKIPIIQNVDSISKIDSNALKIGLVKQLYKPVKWVDIIYVIKEQNVNNIIECGPGKVLSGLIKRIERSLSVISIVDKTSLFKAIELI